MKYQILLPVSLLVSYLPSIEMAFTNWYNFVKHNIFNH